MKQEKSDLLRNSSLSAIASIPYVGGVLSYILDKKLPEEINLRYNSFIDDLEKDIISLRQELNCNRFETSEFYSIFIKMMNEVVANHIEEKTILYRNILLNTLDTSWNCRKNDFFFLITSQISVDAINLLFCTYWNMFAEYNMSSPMSKFMRRFPSKKNYVTAIISELVRFNLIKTASLKDTSLTELGQQYCRFVFSPVHPNWQGDLDNC